MKIPSKYFLSPKVEVRESKIHGKGLFAKEKIQKNEVIAISEGDVLTLDEAAKLTDEERGICTCIDDYHLFCPKDFKNIPPDWCINHSCDPNSGSPPDIYTQIAIKDIEIGEEITFDYAMTDIPALLSNWECNCGALNCRKAITSNDWQIPELQERYKGFFQKNIQDKIEAASDDSDWK